MKSLVIKGFLAFLMLIPAMVIAQNAGTNSIDEGSVGDQFDYVIKKSNNWTDPQGRVFEVVRRGTMVNLRKNAVDSLNAVRNTLNQTQSIVTRQQTEIDTLKASISRVQSQLDSSIAQKDSMSFLGKSMSKGAYNFLVWSIILGLLGLLGFFIFKFKNSNYVTRSANVQLEKLENEFSEHKRIALEREQKIKRKLQDEINKNRG